MLNNPFRNLRTDFASIPLGIKLVSLIIFLRTLGWGFIDPFFSIYLRQFQGEYSWIGFFASLISFSAFLTLIPLLRLADRVEEKTLIRDGESLYVFVVMGYLLAGFFKSIPLLVMSLIINGVAQTLLIVGTETYIRKHDGEGKAGPFGFYIGMDYLGWILGMFIAAFTVQYYGFDWMFLFIVPSIVASFIILPRLREHGIRSLLLGLRRFFHTRKDVWDIVQDVRALNPKIVFFLFLAFFDGVLQMFTYIFIPLLALSLKLDFTHIALLMALMYFPFIFSYFFSEISDRMGKMNVIAIGLFIGSISFISLYFVIDQLWLIVLASAISLCAAIIRPTYNGALSRLAPRRMMGEVTGINHLADRIGRIAGPILTGLIADAFGIQTAFLAIAFVAFGLGIMTITHRSYEYWVGAK